MTPIIAATIFILAYIFIASEKINKTSVALLGASLMLIFHIISQDKAFEHIDMNVIFLLISMMVLVKIMEKTGIFEFIAIKFAKMAKGNPYKIMVILFFLTAVFSAFLDNITTVLLIAPVSILLAKELEISPMPFLIVQIFASNIGGTATLIGDPPNIMIGSAAGLSFLDFLINVGPIVLILMIIFALLFIFIFKGSMTVTNKNRARIMDFNENNMIRDKKLLRRSLIIFAGVIIGFMIHGFVDLEAASIAISGAAFLMIFSGVDTEEILKEVEWSGISFFIGLFIMVGALVETGVIKLISTEMLNFTHGDVQFTAKIMIWFSGIFSAIVDNIPFVATTIPLVNDVGTVAGKEAIEPIWWALSLGACLGGNGTLIGASANIIVANFAEKSGSRIGFLSFLKYSIPLTLFSLLVSYIYLVLRYF
ncbi:MAG: ArsB/NhaD family transporter [Candidatus Delongbacteria bacterium]|nr:ArsB/NhaD family transporter [Candidatus Delongbacteria bacterium]